MPLFGTTKPKEPAKPKERKSPARLPVNKGQCEALVNFMNLAVQVSPWREDALDETESTALVNSLYRAAKTNIWLGNLVVRLVTVSDDTQLLAVAGAIVIVRLANHQMVPPMAGIAAGMMIQGVAGEPIDEMGAGSAPGADRPDRDGQNDNGGTAPEQPPVRPDASREIGYISLAEFQADPLSTGNGYGEAEPGRLSAPYPKPQRGGPRKRIPSGDPEGI